uniref:Platelet-derived growth factor (PDGF) family profile domain-containing protein n=1 Tax=Cyprinus carpio TaxID=7962 RepID=A0A8C1LVX6_CYPCA
MKRPYHYFLYVSSLCKPRETLVKVEDEFPEVMHRRIFPSCVPLQRCGGCCSDEATLCVNVSSYTTVSSPYMFYKPDSKKVGTLYKL